MGKKSKTYDPEDDLAQFNISNLTPEELATPEIIQIFLVQQREAISRQKQLEEKLDIREKKIEELAKENESLKIKVAQTHGQDKFSWIEVPISWLGGYAINLLTDGTETILGMVIIGICLLILLFLRGSQIITFVQEQVAKRRIQ